MAIDISQLSGALEQFISQLPSILFIGEILFYVLFLLFLGSISVIGFRGFAGMWKMLFIRIGSGAVSLLCGISLAPFFSKIIPLKGIIMDLFMLDLIIASVFSALILLFALYIISKQMDSKKAIQKKIASLQERLKNTKDVSPKPFMKRPLVVAGILVIIALLVASLINFESFPNYYEKVFESFGLDIDDLAELQKGLNQGDNGTQADSCISTVAAFSKNATVLAALAKDYEDAGLKSQIESNSKSTVISMKKIETPEATLIIAVTENGKTCIATKSKFCSCLE